MIEEQKQEQIQEEEQKQEQIQEEEQEQKLFFIGEQKMQSSMANIPQFVGFDSITAFPLEVENCSNQTQL